MEGDIHDEHLKIAGMFSKNQTEAVCAGINYWKDCPYFFIRVFVQSIENADELIPTKNGISLRLEKYPELLAGINAVGDVVSGEKVLAKIKKNNAQEVRVVYRKYKDMPLIDVRTFSLAKNGDAFPCSQGVSIRVEQYPHLLEITEKLGELINEYDVHGLDIFK